MTADEARKLLGVELGADKSTVRRAYLRLLKVHKPETDPEGFQRLREAYELLEEIARYEVVRLVPTDAAAPRVEPNEPSSEDPADRDTPLGPAELPFAAEPFAFPHVGPVTPASRVERYSTLQDRQRELLIEVFQGEHPSCNDNTKLGEYKLKDLPPRPAGQTCVDVRLSYDLNGILEVEMNVVGTARKEVLVIERNPGQLTRQQVVEFEAALQSQDPKRIQAVREGLVSLTAILNQTR